MFPASLLALLIVAALCATAAGVLVLAILFVRDWKNNDLW